MTCTILFAVLGGIFGGLAVVATLAFALQRGLR